MIQRIVRKWKNWWARRRWAKAGQAEYHPLELRPGSPPQPQRIVEIKKPGDTPQQFEDNSDYAKILRGEL